MPGIIKKLTIRGFKSIRELKDFELQSVNVLIGANGTGKSNFVSFFRLLRELIEQRLQVALQKTEGGADGCLYMGPKVSPQFAAQLYFGQNGYEFILEPTSENKMVFTKEVVSFEGNFSSRTSLGSGHLEANLKDKRETPARTSLGPGVPYYVYESISKWVVYHFHDTSPSAGVRRQRSINDNETLRADGENLAAFLYRLRETDQPRYEKIRSAIRLAAPFFDDFKLRPVPASPDLIQLEWTQRGSDYPFQANQLSDGTLRFMCLATALLQPFPPSTILIDEPELGLHPYALTILGSLINRTFKGHLVRVGQIIISTQSVQLLSEFTPEDVIVVERHEGESKFRRLKSEELTLWLEDYSLGELWQKNVLGGRPESDSLVPGQ